LIASKRKVIFRRACGSPRVQSAGWSLKFATGYARELRNAIPRLHRALIAAHLQADGGTELGDAWLFAPKATEGCGRNIPPRAGAMNAISCTAARLCCPRIAAPFARALSAH